MGTIKERNFMDLSETKDIKKRGHRRTTEKKFMTQIITMV